ncbi:hypothetical protein U0355_09525 [Salimicrobium sp. PL1-032A]|uniref:hypothetical protein n=1 Tax=Salimicrobium sp. PL1-032A TaxID=3095364 RepID=UPI0032614477
MNIDMDSLITFLIMWGTPAFMMARTYWKMDPEERTSAKKDFKSARFVSTIGLLTGGCFIASIGNLLDLKVLTFTGCILMILAGITITIDMWRKNKIKSVVAPLLIAFAIFLLIKP